MNALNNGQATRQELNATCKEEGIGTKAMDAALKQLRENCEIIREKGEKSLKGGRRPYVFRLSNKDDFSSPFGKQD